MQVVCLGHSSDISREARKGLVEKVNSDGHLLSQLLEEFNSMEAFKKHCKIRHRIIPSES